MIPDGISALLTSPRAIMCCRAAVIGTANKLTSIVVDTSHIDMNMTAATCDNIIVAYDLVKNIVVLTFEISIKVCDIWNYDLI